MAKSRRKPQPRPSRVKSDSPESKEVLAPVAPPPSTWRRWLPIPALLLILGLAAAVRIIPSVPMVFPSKGEVRLYDTDPYYHLRHARYAVKHFPHLQRLDPSIYPAGTTAWYVGGFDLAIAGAALIVGGGHPSESTIEHVAAWTPLVMGLLCFVAMYALGAVVAGPGAGLLAALLLLLYPGTFYHRSLVGAVDHHVAEVLLAILTLVGLTRCVQVSRAEPARPIWRPAVVHALPLSIFLFTWFGAPIYIVLVAVVLFVAAVIDLARGEGQAIGRAAVRYAAGLLVVLIPARFIMPWLVMESEFFTRTLYSIVAFGAGIGLFVAGVRFAVARGLRPRVAAALGTLAIFAVTAAALIALPHIRELLLGLLSEKSNLVKEQRDVTFSSYWHYGGVAGLLAVVAPIIALVDAIRGRDSRSRLVSVLGAALLVALWVRSRDYGYVAGSMVAYLAAIVLIQLVQEVRRAAGRVAIGVAAAAALGIPIAVKSTQRPLIPSADLGGLMLLTDGWVQALSWMRAHTPPLALPLDTTIKTKKFHHPQGNYGVLAFWDWGHYVADLGERPPLASGGISGNIAHWYFITDENEALHALTDHMSPGDQVRYVFADARTEGDFVLAAFKMADYDYKKYQKDFAAQMFRGFKIDLWVYNDRFYNSIGSRLYDRDGDGLAHFRLVYASPERSALSYISRPDASGAAHISRHATPISDDNQLRLWQQVAHTNHAVEVQNSIVYQATIQPSVKLFEVVAGAHLVGQAPAGSHVDVQLDLRAREGKHQVHFHRTATADAQGRFDIIVPYPTQSEPTSDMAVDAPYAVEIDGVGTKRVSVAVADVEEGRSVEVR